MKSQPKLFLLLVVSCVTSQLYAPTAQQSSALLAQADRWRSPGSFPFSMSMQLFEGTSQSPSQELLVYVGSDQGKTVLARVIAPAAQAGRLILGSEASYWLLDRGMNQALRISARQSLHGDASTGDLTRLTFSSQYEVTNSASEADQVRLWLSALPGSGATYPRIELLLHGATGKPIEAHCQGSNGNLIKTLFYTEYYSSEKGGLLREFLIQTPHQSDIRVVLSDWNSQSFDPAAVSPRNLARIRLP